MNERFDHRPVRYRRSSATGSILIYVMWILALISGLAFQLTSNSRVTTLNQSVTAKQLKTRMQIESAIQFAKFRIMADDWQERRYQIFLNQQNLRIEIFNESGFVSIYNPHGRDLKNVFASVGLDQETIDTLGSAFDPDGDDLRINSFDELLRFDGIDSTRKTQLASLVSIYHEDAINPWHSPPGVLLLLDNVDQFRVQKLAQEEDTQARRELRNELVDIISRREEPFSEDIGDYFRVRISLGADSYRVILKADRRRDSFTTLLIERDHRPVEQSSI